jgi:sec-independent protein translocase protein TatC
MTAYSDSYDRERQSREQGSMSFLEHLDELRRRLMRSAFFVVIAFMVCWFVSDKIYHFLEVPVRAAMMEAKKMVAVPLTELSRITLNDLPDGQKLKFTFPTDAKIEDKTLVPNGSTVDVQVKRATPNDPPQLVTNDYWFVNSECIIKPGFVIPESLTGPKANELSRDNELVVLKATGAFNLYIEVSFYAALFLSVPFLLWQAWGFISPGLYEHEKRYAVPFVLMASVFFLLGCAFAYYVAFPRAANYLLSVAAGGRLRPQLTADDYFDLILTIMLGLGVVFEIPTITYFLSRLGLINHKILLKIWRWAIIVIFIIAAVLTPTTDIPNMMIFAAPMILLYFLSVGIAWAFHRKRMNDREAAAQS